MANIYCTATNTGKGFFTQQDRADFYLGATWGNVWVLSDKPKATAWINRVSGTSKTKAEAQEIVDVEIAASQAAYDNLSPEQQAGGTMGALGVPILHYRAEPHTLP